MLLNNIGNNNETRESYKNIDYNNYLREFAGTRTPRKTDLKEINELEENIGSKLPNDYIDFLLRFNGGIGLEEEAKGGYLYRLKKIRNFSRDIENGGVEDLHGIINDDMSGLFDTNKYNLLKGGIGPNFINIGNTGNHRIYMGIGKNNYGKVFHWDPEAELDYDEARNIEAGEESEYFNKYLGEDGKIDPYYNMYFIANSFEEFIRGLMTDEEYEKKYGKR